MHTKGAGGGSIGKIEVEVENIFTAHGALLVQFFKNNVDEQIARFKLIGNLPQDWQHILLSAQLHAIVNLSVKMNGKVTNLQQRSFDVQQHCVGVHHIVAAHDNTSGKGKWAVEPC